MKRVLARLLPALIAVAVVVLAAGATEARALDSCTAMTPCLPQNASFTSVIPSGGAATFIGTPGGSGALFGANNMGNGLHASGVQGNYNGGGRGSGVHGETSVSLNADAAGVYGLLTVTTPAATAAGVRGEAVTMASTGMGVLGLHASSGLGVVGSTPTGVGVLGVASTSAGTGIVGYNPPGLAGYFLGDVHVEGTLSKSAGAFRIDHPFDPTHRYLQHSFVESPDMKNVYDGVVRTDRRGFATVRLPRYFQALNRSFRYQLTSLAGLQNVAVAREIAHNRFVIQSEKPRSRVSWQVTGIRKDRYANAHRVAPELVKPAGEQGTYLAPELYGRPPSASGFRRLRGVIEATR
jgi:hypothetical protein